MIKLSDILERCSQSLQESAALAAFASGIGGNQRLLIQVGMPADERALAESPAVMLVPQPWSVSAGQGYRPYGIAAECRIRANDAAQARAEGKLPEARRPGARRHHFAVCRWRP